MKFLLPVFLALIGGLAGIGAGLYLKPAHEAVANAAGTEMLLSESHANSHSGTAPQDDSLAEEHMSATSGVQAVDTANTEFTKLNNQFVVPVLSEGRVKSMVVLSLSLETPLGKRELIFSREPRIRDMFLQVLFDHANTGGFDGAFTSGANMSVLRGELRRAAKQLLRDDVIDVLVTDIARQDLD